MYPQPPPTPQRANNREKTFFVFTLVLLITFAAYRLIDRYMEMREVEQTARMLNTGIEAIKQIQATPTVTPDVPASESTVTSGIPTISPVVPTQPIASNSNDYLLRIQPAWNHFTDKNAALWQVLQSCVNNPQYWGDPNRAPLVQAMNNTLIQMDSDLTAIGQALPTVLESNALLQQVQNLQGQVSQLRSAIDAYLRQSVMQEPGHLQAMTQCFEKLDYSIDAIAEELNASSTAVIFQKHGQRDGQLGDIQGVWPGSSGHR